MMITLDCLAACWIVLNELLGELTREGVFIPDLTYADFRNSKLLLEYLRSYEDDVRLTEGTDATLRMEMEERIYTLRQTLMVWAEERKGVEYRQHWEDKFEAALRGEIPLPEEEKTAPITELPREKGIGFFRIKLPEEIPVEIISEIAEECRVLICLDGERHLLVSGKKKCVRDAMRQIGEIFYGESRLKTA
ncbi:MAG: hypothetical protein DRO73_02725 [Candidatus Thorarchaeota archaeon]|nr:MAG: hypothetical protein DRO73_02725 [Candidatus Thorarchaeota archaeon]RLI62634.1 MAG: hypothetical protein DRO93_00505 [Candidatus Thorarchaeota archaeon]